MPPADDRSVVVSFGRRVPTQEEACGSDRRAAEREPAGLHAKATFGDVTKECEVVDLSRTGARVRLPSFTALPDKFELYVPERQAVFRATVQWRLNAELGVAFDPGSSGAGAHDESLLARVEKLEATVTALERILSLALRAREPAAALPEAEPREAAHAG